MNYDVDRSPNVLRAQRWFHHSEREQRVRREEQLRERERIARDLHDTLFQGFLGAPMQLQVAVQEIPSNSPGQPSLRRALHMMRRVIEEGRETLRGLRSSPMGALSLEQALSSLQVEFAPEDGAQYRIFVNGETKPLEPAVQEQIYLILREALVNALRHSKATSIEAEIDYLPRRLRVVVRDNGCGMDPEIVRSGRESHWGLQGMRERAEAIGVQLRILSRRGAGTEVEISVPSHLLADNCA